MLCWYSTVRRRKTGRGGSWESSASTENVKNHEGASFGGFLEWISHEKVVISSLYRCDKTEPQYS